MDRRHGTVRGAHGQAPWRGTRFKARQAWEIQKNRGKDTIGFRVQADRVSSLPALMPKVEYVTTDIYLASFISHRGATLTGLRRLDPKKIEFKFVAGPELHDLLRLYWSCRLTGARGGGRRHAVAGVGSVERVADTSGLRVAAGFVPRPAAAPSSDPTPRPAGPRRAAPSSRRRDTVGQPPCFWRGEAEASQWQSGARARPRQPR